MFGRALGHNQGDVDDTNAFLLINNELARLIGRPPHPDGLTFLL